MYFNKRSAKTKSLLINLSILILSIILFILVLEGILRIFLQDYTVYSQESDLLTYDPLLGIATKPNIDVIYSSKVDTQFQIKTNSLGWRDDNFTEEKEKKYRIEVYGDSFTYGVGVNQPDIFTEKLEKNYLNNTEVLNFGLIASGTDQQYLYFTKKGKYYNSDAYILVFYVGNDFIDNIRTYEKRPYYEIVDNSLFLKNFPPPEKNYTTEEFYPFPLNIHAYMSKNSYAYNFIFKRLIALKPVKNILKETEFGREYFLGTSTSWIYLKNQTEDYKKSIEITKRLINQFKREAGDKYFLVVIIPTREEVYGEYWDLYTSELEINKDELDREKPKEKIIEICKDLNIEYLDMTEEFSKAKNKVYFNIDAHTNKIGHDIIASKISERLIKGGVAN